MGLTAFQLESKPPKSLHTIDYSSHEALKDTSYSQAIASILLEMKRKHGDKYSDSLQRHIYEIRDQLIGTKMDNFTFTDVQGKLVELKNYNKPLVMEISASWCGPCIASTDVINDLSKTYRGKLDFLVLTHDPGKRAQEYAAKFDSERIRVIPSSETIDIMEAIKLKIGDFNHIFPFPTAYFIDKDFRIVDIRIGGSLPGEFPNPEGGMMTISKEQAYKDNLKILQAGIDKILTN